jgi:hypothetical protein
MLFKDNYMFCWIKYRFNEFKDLGVERKAQRLKDSKTQSLKVSKSQGLKGLGTREKGKGNRGLMSLKG